MSTLAEWGTMERQAMDRNQSQQPPGNFLVDCERIHREWHERAKALDTDGLLTLYAVDAVLESPLVPAILNHKPAGVLRGQAELRRFLTRARAVDPTTLYAGIARASG